MNDIASLHKANGNEHKKISHNRNRKMMKIANGIKHLKWKPKPKHQSCTEENYMQNDGAIQISIGPRIRHITYYTRIIWLCWFVFFFCSSVGVNKSHFSFHFYLFSHSLAFLFYFHILLLRIPLLWIILCQHISPFLLLWYSLLLVIICSLFSYEIISLLFFWLKLISLIHFED